MAKFVGENRLTYLWGKIKTWVGTYVSMTSDNGVYSLTVGSNTITPVTDVSGKANASEMSVSTSGDQTTITLKSGTSATVINAHQDISGKLNASAVGVANGVCPLDSNSMIDAQYLPSFVDDVVEAYIVSGETALSSTWLATGSASGTVITPSAGKIYVIMNGTDDYPTNSQYRWGGSAYVKLNDGGMSEMTEAEMDAATSNWS